MEIRLAEYLTLYLSGFLEEGDIRVINFLVHPGFRKYILLHVTEKKSCFFIASIE